MTTAEKIELALIPVIGIGCWLAAPGLPVMMDAGRLLLVMSVLLLFQGLVRDLWLLIRHRQSLHIGPARTARCMCVESTVGTTGILVGAILLGSGIDRSIVMTPSIWSILAMVIMAAGFAMKDYVVESSPWRIRRDKDHINIVFTWKQ